MGSKENKYANYVNLNGVSVGIPEIHLPVVLAIKVVGVRYYGLLMMAASDLGSGKRQHLDQWTELRGQRHSLYGSVQRWGTTWCLSRACPDRRSGALCLPNFRPAVAGGTALLL